MTFMAEINGFIFDKPVSITGTMTGTSGHELGLQDAIKLVSDGHSDRCCKPGHWRVRRCKESGLVVVERKRQPRPLPG